MNRQRLAIGFGILVSIVFLVLAFRGLRPEVFFDSLRDVHPLMVLGGALVYFGALALITWRWQFLLTPIKHITLPRLFQLVSIGYMGNNIYPLRAGEALRIVLLYRDEQVPVFRSTTITVVERIFDGIVMLTFILIGVRSNQLQNDLINGVISIALPLFVVGLIGFVGVALLPDVARRVRDVLLTPFPMVFKRLLVHISDEVLSALASLNSPTRLFQALFVSYASWMVEALVYWIVMAAFGFDLGYTAALLVVGTVNLAGLIPASPGQIGVYEYFASSVLMAFGIAQERALSYALVVHLTIWLPVTLAGFVFLVRRGMGWNDVARAQMVENEA